MTPSSFFGGGVVTILLIMNYFSLNLTRSKCDLYK
jgi:hypothetical protein